MCKKGEANRIYIGNRISSNRHLRIYIKVNNFSLSR